MSNSKSAVITGASSGIGQSCAIAYAKAGYNLVLCARRTDKLESVAQACRQAAAQVDADIRVIAFPADVSQQTQVEALVLNAASEFGRLDVMVNNAGYGMFARVDETDEAELRRIFDVNFFGLFYGCKAAAKVMIPQRSGHIFNVSSVIGKRGTPFHGAYCATKFAIVGLSDSMRVEMQPYNVQVTTVCPALTQTEFFEHSRGGRAAKSSFIKFKSMSLPQTIASKMLKVTGKNKPELVFTAGGKFLTIISALSPKLADLMMGLYYRDLEKSLHDK